MMGRASLRLFVNIEFQMNFFLLLSSLWIWILLLFFIVIPIIIEIIVIILAGQLLGSDDVIFLYHIHFFYHVIHVLYLRFLFWALILFQWAYGHIETTSELDELCDHLNMKNRFVSTLTWWRRYFCIEHSFFFHDFSIWITIIRLDFDSISKRIKNEKDRGENVIFHPIHYVTFETIYILQDPSTKASFHIHRGVPWLFRKIY